ncbi:30S ribosomal protein S1 [Pinisolibacter aquiterrae]|uniref:30S ribosomal protein S1 n=1 Tax=Pinisolibacter aquiterrae TaxID=2815579 RepID=UPI001C3E4408|nr:30S ribosomal protein S1 [Pinisolibacter aquiterrae]MBV5262854.1 30S ribosomal protein S1 [Pinisolibacter aquiterrae]MCC8236432.1 30S ribosomal protein S1 [Pinisolibacter aquiterrae]
MSQMNPTRDEFAALLEESFETSNLYEGSVVKGKIVAIEKDLAVIDVGLKVEGRVALKEFGAQGRDGGLKVGDEVEVYLDRVENALGEAVISREKARREESWTRLEEAFAKNEKVTGLIFNQVKGGFTVDLDGAVAFLPRSQVDIRPVRDVGPLMHVPQPFQILKMDKRRGNIVVSRRTVLEETRAEQRSELVQSLQEGQIVDGVVKNITDYGAFVDLGGIDGLLHVTDIAWRRINHPSEVLSIGQTVKVQIIRVNPETHRISLGMKQLEADPWEGIVAKYPVNAKFAGRVTNITDYGAFVELEPGIEGLIHVSEMSWTKKNVHPGKIVSTSQEVEVMVLEVDPVKRRISLGLKQTLANPWETFVEKYPAGTVVEGEVKNKTEFGLFVGLDGDVDGMVHLSDLDWNRPGEQVIEEFRRGDKIKAVVLDVDVDKERISLGVKQLAGDPFEKAGDIRRGAIVTCEVTEVKDSGIDVKIVDSEFTTFIKRSELARERGDQRPDRFAVGERLDARVIQFDRKTRKVSVSIKALEMAEEKEAIAQFGSSDSGASLGDILGAALRARTEDK